MKKKKTGSQEEKTGQGNQEKQQHPERGRQDTTAQQSYLIHVPTFLLWYEEIRTQYFHLC